MFSTWTRGSVPSSARSMPREKTRSSSIISASVYESPSTRTDATAGSAGACRRTPSATQVVRAQPSLQKRATVPAGRIEESRGCCMYGSQ